MCIKQYKYFQGSFHLPQEEGTATVSEPLYTYKQNISQISYQYMKEERYSDLQLTLTTIVSIVPFCG